ncbi:hypothetical protein ACLOJK_031674 [Asimina triloba]
MSCAVAVAASSPVFSPSTISSRFCNHETLTLLASPSSSSSSSCSSPSPSPSAFRLRYLQKSASGLRVCNTDAVVGSEIGPSSAALPRRPSVLKRKRPARIDIPPVDSLTIPPPEEGVKEVAIESERYSVFCKKGRREVMEDRHAAVLDIHGDPKKAFFGVFDGHGGTGAAEFAAANLGKNVMDEVMKRESDEMEVAVRSGYVMTDAELLKEKNIQGGTCCATALIKNSKLVVSNAGDCRIVMSRGGIAEALTVDHRPSREDERCRIEALGGYVDCRHGVWRLQGSLAVSRGIGDSHLKQWLTAEPESKILRIKDDCEFLILASDGLWDKVSNQEAVDIARTSCCTGLNSPSTLSACKQLVNLSVTRGSADDINGNARKLMQLVNFVGRTSWGSADDIREMIIHPVAAIHLTQRESKLGFDFLGRRGNAVKSR